MYVLHFGIVRPKNEIEMLSTVQIFRMYYYTQVEDTFVVKG